MKVYIRKDFEAMKWSFILEVSKASRFSATFCSYIFTILKFAWVYIIINGSHDGYFKCSKGTHQGNPLSPFPFGLAKVFLSRCLLRLVH